MANFEMSDFGYRSEAEFILDEGRVYHDRAKRYAEISDFMDRIDSVIEEATPEPSAAPQRAGRIITLASFNIDSVASDQAEVVSLDSKRPAAADTTRRAMSL